MFEEHLEGANKFQTLWGFKCWFKPWWGVVGAGRDVRVLKPAGKLNGLAAGM